MSVIPTRTCDRCGLQIGWVTTVEGRRMPIDPEPNEAGNVIVRRQGRGGKLIAEVLNRSKPRPQGVAFMPHFATCGKPAPKVEPEPPPTLDLDQ